MMNDSLFMNDPETYFNITRALSFVFGGLLVASVFLPWFSASPFGMNFSVSGIGFNEMLGVVAILGGVAAAVGSFMRENKVSGLASIVVGVVAILTFFLLISSYPKLALEEGPFSGVSLSIVDVLKEVKVSAGFFFYFLSSAGLIISGILTLVVDNNNKTWY